MPVMTVSQKFIRPWGGKIFKGLWGKPKKTADFGTSLWQIPYTSNLCLLEDKIQNWGMYLFTISYGSYAMDQRSGDGWISGSSQIYAFYQRNSWTRTRELLLHWTKSSRIPASRKRSVWRKWKLTKKTDSNKEDRSLTWSTNSSGSLVPMILSRIMQTYLQLFFEMMIFRKSSQSGKKFYYWWHKSRLMAYWKACAN